MDILSDSYFASELYSELRPDCENIEILHEPLLFWSARLQEMITIPVGFQSDAASVPRVPIIYEAYGNRAHREGFLHDYLFRVDCCPNVSWMTANKIFLDAMRCRNKSWFTRTAMFLGVCIGSYPCFHQKYVMDVIKGGTG